MSIINNEYKEILKIFKLEKKSFKIRKENVKNTSFTTMNWSSSYLDFFPYSSVINQLKTAVIYKDEKTPSIKNYYLKDKLVFAFNSENDKWGTLFIEHEIDSKKLLLFVENDDELMVLQQLKVAYFENNRYKKVLSYMNDEDESEESLSVDLFEYDIDGKIIKITRHGFYEENSKILPIREFDFSYHENNVKIFAKDDLGKNILVYDGKRIL